MKVKTIILAAGQGTRMRSSLPKVLHKIANRSLLQHVYDTSKLIDDNEILIIYGHAGELVKQTLSGLDAKWIKQKEQLGTGHAVLQAKNMIADEDTILILYADVPLLEKQSIDRLLENVSAQSMGLLTTVLDNPIGYGRIVRDEFGNVRKIVEQQDASKHEQLITEVNTGIFAVQGKQLKNWITQLDNHNTQQEFYLTDIIAMAVNDGIAIKTSQPKYTDEVLGVNNRKQLSHLERVYQNLQADKLMASGVTLLDPARIDCRGTFASLGQDISVDINVIFVGNNTLGNHVNIGANTMINNSIIGDHVEILANCIIDNAIIGAASRIGPFARLRPLTKLCEQVHIGNFVEIKKTTVSKNSKINHLSYIGDATIGRQVNIGAGTITCNYDGANKLHTVIEDGAFIGSDTQLIAPVTIGKNATIGAGSTITKTTPDNQLTLTRHKQISIQGWQRPIKKEG